MKFLPLRWFWVIALTTIAAGLSAQGVIKLTTQRKAGETIKLKIQAQGDYTIEGVKEPASSDKSKKNYTLTSSTIQIKGDVLVLECSSNDLTEIDLSQSTSLKELTASMNLLKTVVTDNLLSLNRLDLYGNQIEWMDLTNNKSLTVLDLSQNCLKAVRLGALPVLEELGVSDNQLKGIDLTGCDNLNMLLCYNNRIPLDQMLLMAQGINNKKNEEEKIWVAVDTESGVDKNQCSQALVQMAKAKGWVVYDYKKTNMELFAGTPDPVSLSTRPIELTTALPVGSEIALIINGLGNIEIEGVKEKVTPSSKSQKFTLMQSTLKIKGYVTQLGCPAQQVTDLDLGDMASLTFLYVGSNQLSSLNPSACPNLRVLHCGKNQIKTLDLSKHKELELFNGNGNQLSLVDLSSSDYLQDLRCGSNATLSELRLPETAPLVYLECASCQLSKLNLTPYKNTLATVFCYENKIQELDLADAPRLKLLYCGYNQIRSLKIGKAPILFELACGANGIEGELDIAQAPAVSALMCSNNKLSQIRVSPGGRANYIECYGNSMDQKAVNILAESLPKDDTGYAEIYVIDSKGTGTKDNDCTEDAVKLIKSKGWSVWDNNGDDPVEYPGRPTGIDCPTIQNSGSVTLFPNPSSEVLYIENGEPFSTIMVRSILGEFVYKTILDSWGSVHVPVASWDKGTYIVEIGGKAYRFMVD